MKTINYFLLFILLIATAAGGYQIGYLNGRKPLEEYQEKSEEAIKEWKKASAKWEKVANAYEAQYTAKQEECNRRALTVRR